MTSLLILILIIGAAWPWVRPSRADPHRDPEDSPPKPHSNADVVDIAVVLDLAGASLSSGLSVPATLECLAEATAPGAQAEACRASARALHVGAPWDQAWAGAPPATQPLRTALGAAWVDGVDPLPLLARAATTLRESRAEAAKHAAEKLAIRLVLPLGLCYLPAFVLIGIMPVILSASFDLLGR